MLWSLFKAFGGRDMPAGGLNGKIKLNKDSVISFLTVYIWLGIFSFLTYTMLLFGASNNINVNRYWLHNIMICYLINILVFNIVKKKWVLIFISCFSFIWSVVSHFVLQLHGTALCFTLFKNIRTAVTVIDNYNLTMDLRVFVIALLLTACIGTVMLFPGRFIELCFGIKILFTEKLLFFVFFAIYGVYSFYIANDKMSWAPFFLIEQRGYCSYLITDSIYCFDHFRRPKGYDEDLIPEGIEGWDDNISDTDPDIILILNEAFSDITRYSDVQLDSDPLSELDKIDGLTRGYCIAPNAGGGTNTSEYELLTSNSSSLLSVEAPFNYINFEKNNDSIVPYLKKNNYTTYAFHCFSKENYNRRISYKAMGFDEIFLGPDSFKYHSSNGNRQWLDKDNYNDLIRIYEENPDSPKFMYLLTYQNHGGYEQNPPELDTIHSVGDYPVSNGIIDEYVSSVELSAHAFKELTDYFSEVERPVIICMVGDHTFSYSTALNTVSESGTGAEVENRTVPYLVWANYPIDTKAFTGYTCMTDLIPGVLYSAGIELDDYYKQVLDLHELMPGRTTFGVYVDNEGNIKNMADDPVNYDTWIKYQYSEYKRLTN